MRTIILGMLLISLGVIACKNTSKTSDTDIQKPYLEFKKGGCHGTCPIYTLLVYENGVMIYDGERFTDRLGKHSKKLSKEELKAIKSNISGIDVWAMPDKYESRIPDLASSTLTVFKGEETKSVFWRENAPNDLKAFGMMLEAIAKVEQNWVLIEDQALPAYVIPNEIIVNLKEEVKAESWIRNYASYKATLGKRVAPNMNYWVIRYDISTISAHEMLNKINNDKAHVIQAEFNKKTTMRN